MEHYGLTWTGDEKMAKTALDEWDMQNAKEVDTPGVIDEKYEEETEPMNAAWGGPLPPHGSQT